MAASLSTTIPSILFTADLGDILITTDASVRLALTTPSLTDTTQTTTLLSETYTPYNGTVTLYDLATLIEYYLRQNNLTLASFTLSTITYTPVTLPDTGTTTEQTEVADSGQTTIAKSAASTGDADASSAVTEKKQSAASTTTTPTIDTSLVAYTCTDTPLCTFTAVHCPSSVTGITATAFQPTSDNILSVARHRLLYAAAPLSLPIFIRTRPTTSTLPTTRRTYAVDILYTAPDGTLATLNTSLTYNVSFGSPYNITITQADIIDLLHDDQPNATPLRVTLHIGSNAYILYLVSASKVRTFRFRNLFNALDSLSLPTATTSHLTTESSTAIIGDTLALYDITHTRTFEENTPALDADSLHLLSQMLTSHTVEVLDADNTYQPILITDRTYEPSDEPNTAPAVTFTWQYANRRSRLHFTRFRIFSTQFATQFS